MSSCSFVLATQETEPRHISTLGLIHEPLRDGGVSTGAEPAVARTG